MKIAYLILAHNNPAHLQRLVDALSSDHSSFFIHLDAKTDLAPFATLRAPRLTLVEERVAVQWGGFSQVEATLALLRRALAETTRFDRLVLLSGVDYPLRSTAAIEQFFADHPRTEFINLVAMPSARANKPLSRLTSYQIDPALSYPRYLVQRLMLKLGLIARERDYHPSFGSKAPYAGSTWWAVTGEAGVAMLAFAARETALVAFYRNTACADESFFQTVLGNSPFGAHVARALTYTEWSPGAASPATLTERSLPFFSAHDSFPATDTYGPGPMLFARKFGDAAAPVVAALEAQRR